MYFKYFSRVLKVKSKNTHNVNQKFLLVDTPLAFPIECVRLHSGRVLRLKKLESFPSPLM